MRRLVFDNYQFQRLAFKAETIEISKVCSDTIVSSGGPEKSRFVLLAASISVL